MLEGMGPSKPLAWISLLTTQFNWIWITLETLFKDLYLKNQGKRHTQFLKLFPTSKKVGHSSSEVVTANSTAYVPKQKHY